MKKIKIFIVALLVIIGFAFMPPKVQASEVTTDPITTEEVTTIKTGETVDLVDTLEKAKTWVTAGILAIINSGILGVVGYWILTKMKNRALAEVNSAVEQNKISQDTADKATKIINDGMVAVDIKLNNFENNIQNKIEDMNGDIKDLIEKLDSKFLSLFNTAIQEYLESDLEEETVTETEEPEEVWYYD